jgi:hypothetical protein
VLAPHVEHGGFYADDWGNAAAYHFDGWWRTAVNEWRHSIPGRPILAVLHPLPFALFGVHPAYHLAAAVVLAALTSLSFFGLLRALGVEVPHALAMALLALVFPWVGAARLWPAGSLNNIAVIAYFLGSVVALQALSLWDHHRRRAILLHLLAAVLYLISILTYEVAPAAILLSGLLYRTRVSWRALRGRWLFDAVLVLVPLAISLRMTSLVRHVGSFSERVMALPHFVGQDLTLFASLFVPRDVSSSWSSSWDATSSAAGKILVLAGSAAVAGAAVARACRRGEPELRRWLHRAAGGAVGVAAAHVMFLGSGLYPLFYPGLDDRINTFAAFGFVVVAYSVLALAALLIGGRRGRAAIAVLTTGAILIGLGSIQRVRDDVDRYDTAAAEQRQLLDGLESALPHPRPGSTIFTFGFPGKSAPGVPIFETTWDLQSAVALLLNDPSLHAIPVYGESVVCGRAEVSAMAFGPESATSYGRAVFVDVPTARTLTIRSLRECARARELFTPGPVFVAARSWSRLPRLHPEDPLSPRGSEAYRRRIRCITWSARRSGAVSRQLREPRICSMEDWRAASQSSRYSNSR